MVPGERIELPTDGLQARGRFVGKKAMEQKSVIFSMLFGSPGD
jgi:hypothetical protein